MLVLIAALVASYVTRRNAKDTSALSGFSSLATELRSELTDAKKDIRALQEEERRRGVLARVHAKWDDLMVREIRKLDPDVNIPDPPPLD